MSERTPHTPQNEIRGQYASDVMNGEVHDPTGTLDLRGDGSMAFHSSGLYGTAEGDLVEGSWAEDVHVVDGRKVVEEGEDPVLALGGYERKQKDLDPKTQRDIELDDATTLWLREHGGVDGNDDWRG